MLDTDTKRRIDTARDILVGKVPDPKTQVEQITIALIYKFMDDMDAEAEELGGKRKFFTGEFARYGWAKLMRPGLGGHEMLDLYAEGIAKMPREPRHPAALPRHLQERLPPVPRPRDAQGLPQDHRRVHLRPQRAPRRRLRVSALRPRLAGRRRPVPHPAPHHRFHRRDRRSEEERDRPRPRLRHRRLPHLRLQAHPPRQHRRQGPQHASPPTTSGRLAKNFKGYDISPDMVRLSLVNLYLHGFTDPHIYEYDTLTSEDRWNEFADVILANPPFMSPKGGIKPHNRFSSPVQAQRSALRGLHGRAPHAHRPRRHHRPRGHHLPEPDRLQSSCGRCSSKTTSSPSSPCRPACFNPYSGVKTSHPHPRQVARQAERHHRLLQGGERRLRPRRPAPRRSRRTTCRRSRPNSTNTCAPCAATKSSVADFCASRCGPDRAEGEDRREWRLQPQRRAVSGGQQSTRHPLPACRAWRSCRSLDSAKAHRSRAT